MRVEAKPGNSVVTVSGTELLPAAGCDMTTFNTAAKASQAPGRFRLPDPPEREPDEKMTQYDQLFRRGNSHHLAVHLGRPETTLVEADRWIIAEPGTFRDLARYPDLLVAFDVHPALYKASNGYIISEQGKPPDFVLEVASESTADIDVGEKRQNYATLGIGEYWRFDETETGRYHGARLAGEQLVDGEYVALEIEELPDDSLKGYSAVLNLSLRWERGELVFYDPTTEQPIATFEDERARADNAETERNAERQARITEQARAAAAEERANAEREARAVAEARIRELEERLKQQGA